MMYRTIILIGLLGLSSTFWFYSRFTVDDAFITWRYGKNLIEYGVWNYNPSFIDITQAYTNPIFAILAILPAAINIDVVFFFKVLSLLNLFVFSIWYIRQTKGSYVTLLLLLGMPATIVHLFGGLETFLYVSLVSALFIALDKNNKWLSIFVALVLFLTRPESWLLAILIPLFFSIKNPPTTDTAPICKKYHSFFKLLEFDGLGCLIIGGTLAAPLIFHLLLNKNYFGYFLPNPFYIKSSDIFSINQLIKLSFFITPLFLLVLFGRTRIFLFIFIYSFSIVLKYSISDLQMDYSCRFAFHIFFPIYVFLIYISSTRTETLKLTLNENLIAKLSLEMGIKIIAILFLLVFFKISGISDTWQITYYPRALDSHSLLGKTLSQIKDKYNIQIFAIGDAGMAAYHADLRSFDNIGLGSSLLTQKGLNLAIDSYKPDLIAFYAHPNGIHLNKHYQAEMLEWANANGLLYVCDIYWQQDFIFKIYSRRDALELKDICKISKMKNDINDSSYLKSNWIIPPWHYWRE
jgi:hypothetical protein